MSVRDLLSPFAAWKYLLREPVTIKDPLNDRPGSRRYRGFHKNDIDECIGCGTCEVICQNGAIDMLPTEGEETEQGDSGLRPRIDYGRCCWCALCVDVCMTGSLTMSNEYTWIGSDPSAFLFTPGVEKKSWDRTNWGYRRPAGYRLTPAARVEMGEMEPEVRIDSFSEIVAGYGIDAGQSEADRCVSCGLCVATCPTHMAIPDYIAAVRDGDYERGLQLLYETNPFSEVCGRICTHKCETVCAVQHEGAPVAIRWLKRHITDQVPYERYCSIIGDPAPASGKRVAVIGAGPAGLTAAFDLVRKGGHKVVVYEARKKPGGMTRYGIPEYRLPYDIIDRDIDLITSLGVTINCSTRVGVDISMQQLQQEHDAVLLAIGMHLGRSTRVPGADMETVTKAVDLLRKITDGEEVEVPRQAVVIGGGNVAMDIARTMARLQQQTYGKVRMTVTALEDLAHFLADPEEVKECREEGIEILDARGPQEMVIDDDGNLVGLKSWRVISIFDEQGKFAPSYDESDEQIHYGDMVIEAIGQMSDVSLLGEELTERLEWNRGRISVDAAGCTAEPWLWAIGDCVKGPDVVTAVADGHRAAASIDSYMNTEE